MMDREQSSKDLIRLGLRALGQASKDRSTQKTMKEKFHDCDNELMGVWRSACALGLYDALDPLDEMMTVAWRIRLEFAIKGIL